MRTVTVGGVKWTRGADGVWESRFGQVLRDGRHWLLKPNGGMARYPYDTMLSAMHYAKIEGRLRRRSKS